MLLINAKVDKKTTWRWRLREERERCEDHNDLCSMGIYVMKPYCVIHMSNIGIYYVL